MSYTIVNENDASMFIIATLTDGRYVLDVHTIPNDKAIDVRDSKKKDGSVYTYYFEPEK